MHDVIGNAFTVFDMHIFEAGQDFAGAFVVANACFPAGLRFGAVVIMASAMCDVI